MFMVVADAQGEGVLDPHVQFWGRSGTVYGAEHSSRADFVSKRIPGRKFADQQTNWISFAKTLHHC